MSALNRGGLWIITQPAQQLFLKAECHFRQFTSETDLQRLDISGITLNAMSDSDICNLMISNAELGLDSHSRQDVLYGLVSVYINVRSFSFPKDIIQRDIRLRQSRPKQGHQAKKSVGVAKGNCNKGRSETVNSHFILTILLITKVSNDQYHHLHGTRQDRKFHGNT